MDTSESFIVLFSAKLFGIIILLKEINPSPYPKMIKILTFVNLFPTLHFDILAKIRSRMTTAITFSRQNDFGSSACTKNSYQ